LLCNVNPVHGVRAQPNRSDSSDVSASVLQHFVSGERGITLETAGKVAAHLGLALMSTAGK